MKFNFQNVWLYLIIALQIILGFIIIDKGHNWGGDFALYVDEAKSILDGRFLDFYYQNLFTVQNSHQSLAPIAEPIGAPLLFAPFIAIFGVNLYILKYLMLGFCIGLSIVVWKILSLLNFHSPIFKACALLFVFSYYEFAFLLETVNSDLPFAFFTCVSLFYYLKYLKLEKFKFLVIAIFTGTFSYFIRDAGVALCGAYFLVGVLSQLKEQNWRKIVVYIFPLIAISIFKLILPPFNSNLIDDNLSKLSYDRCIKPLYFI